MIYELSTARLLAPTPAISDIAVSSDFRSWLDLKKGRLRRHLVIVRSGSLRDGLRE